MESVSGRAVSSLSGSGQSSAAKQFVVHFGGGALKTREWKTRNWKTRHQIAGVENAGPENGGTSKLWKAVAVENVQHS